MKWVSDTCKRCGSPLALQDIHYWAAWQETFFKCPSCKELYTVYHERQMNWWKRLFLFFFAVTEHNEEHYVTLNLAGENVYACSRCLGAYLSALVCWFAFGAMYFLGIFPLSFIEVFVISMVLGSLTLGDYITVDILHRRKGNNKVRFVAGLFLGVAAMLYFWLLPADWLFKIGTLIIYNLLAMCVALLAVRMRQSDGKTSVSTG